MEVDFQQCCFTQLQAGGEVNQSSVKSAEVFSFCDHLCGHASLIVLCILILREVRPRDMD